MTKSTNFQNHYEILALPTTSGHKQTVDSTTIKSAYHRALLVHHPDKTHSTTPSSTKYTVDQITQAYQILIDPASRAAFDQNLSVKCKFLVGNGDCNVSESSAASETFDLDDLLYDDQQGLWYRGCRCGQDRGFTVIESDLELKADDSEILVGCAGCSLWIRVTFALEDDPGGEERPKG